MPIIHRANSWGLIISSVDGTRPAAGFGTSITPTQNTSGGSYATILSGASVTHDVYGIEININNVGTSGAARDCLATLGFDPAGGTSFTDWADLLCGQAGPYSGTGGTGGHHYYFPLWLKAGTTIGMRASVNSATLTAINAFVRVYCKPTHPELIWCGQKVEQLGVTTASSTGTSVTAGTASEGSWTSIGTTTRNHRYFEFGFGLNDGTCSNNAYSVDISSGDASNKRIIGSERTVWNNSTEQSCKFASPMWAETKSGDIIYARTQVGGSAEDAHSIAVYCMGD